MPYKVRLKYLAKSIADTNSELSCPYRATAQGSSNWLVSGNWRCLGHSPYDNECVLIAWLRSNLWCFFMEKVACLYVAWHNIYSLNVIIAPRASKLVNKKVYLYYILFPKGSAVVLHSWKYAFFTSGRKHISLVEADVESEICLLIWHFQNLTFVG